MNIHKLYLNSVAGIATIAMLLFVLSPVGLAASDKAKTDPVSTTVGSYSVVTSLAEDPDATVTTPTSLELKANTGDDSSNSDMAYDDDYYAEMYDSYDGDDSSDVAANSSTGESAGSVTLTIKPGKYATDSNAAAAEIKSVTVNGNDVTKDVDTSASNPTLTLDTVTADTTIKVAMKAPSDAVSVATPTTTKDSTERKSSKLVLKASPAAVNFTDDAATLESDVYDDLCISLVDSDKKDISFKKSDITLDFPHEAGTQTVNVSYAGNDQYDACTATASVEIDKLTETSVVLADEPKSVNLVDDETSMDAAVLKALAVKVLDAKGDPVDYTDDQLTLTYTRETGNQDVSVKYKGDDTHAASKADGTIKINDGAKATIKTASNATVAMNDDTTAMDKAIYDALEIKVQDKDGNIVKTTQDDFSLSYTNAKGSQDVKIKYAGGSAAQACETTAKVTINDAEKTSLVMTSDPDPIDYNDDDAALDKAVINALSISVVDNENQKIKLGADDITLDYTRQAGDQTVTITYAGNDDYQSCNGTAQITINQE